jgi:hypothetical protein
MEIYTSIDGQHCILSLRESESGASMSGGFLECRYIDYDGSSRFGYVETSIETDSFYGVKRLFHLDAVPIHLYPSASKLVD